MFSDISIKWNFIVLYSWVLSYIVMQTPWKFEMYAGYLNEFKKTSNINCTLPLSFIGGMLHAYLNIYNVIKSIWKINLVSIKKTHINYHLSTRFCKIFDNNTEFQFLRINHTSLFLSPSSYHYQTKYFKSINFITFWITTLKAIYLLIMIWRYKK